jgi:prophage maintenance system killer protein
VEQPCVVCATSLELNGRQVTVCQADVVPAMLGLADGTLTEDVAIDWLERNSAA